MKEKLEIKQRLREVFRYPINLRADNERRQRIAEHETGEGLDFDPYTDGLVKTIFEAKK